MKARNIPTRGYFGIGVYHPKTTENIGTLWREAFLFGANFIFTIGKRYQKQPSDTVKAFRHVPLWEFTSFAEFKRSIPKESKIVVVEMNEKSQSLNNYIHPERAIYILGAEDYGFPSKLIKDYMDVIEIPQVNTISSSNVAVSGSIVLYDRHAKGLSLLTRD